MTDRFDAVAIRIAHERAVVVGTVLRPRPGRPVIAAAGRQCCGMKGTHRPPIGRAEAEMCAGNRGSQFRLAGNGELNAKRSRRRTVIGAAAIAEIDYAHEPERT